MCERSSGELACDTEGVVHPSLCQLQQAGKRLAYLGHCQVPPLVPTAPPPGLSGLTPPPCLQEACRTPQQVCGHDGETYSSACHALSSRVAVDYQGPCHAVGALSEGAPDSACSIVLCPPLSSPGCRPVTPPGE